jgi:hypothetical protein
VVEADRVLEFLESLAEGPTGVGEPFGPEDEERDDQDDDQWVGGRMLVNTVLCFGKAGAGYEEEMGHGRVQTIGRFRGRMQTVVRPRAGRRRQPSPDSS